MNKTKSILKSSLIVVFGMLIIVSCNRKNDGNDVSNDEAGYGTDHARLAQTFNDVENIADQAGNTGALNNYRTEESILSNCATVTRDTVSVPHVMTIDFGATNCLCLDGRYRRGQIIVTYTGHYRDSGATHNITFNNYFVNDNQVTGSKTVTNMGHNAAGYLVYHINVNGAIILANGNGTLSWVSTRNRIWVAGESTMVRSDDVYEITGNGTITRPNGNTITIAISAPLKVANSCNWIEQGIVQITPPNSVVRTMDYGNGNCDNQATLTVNGNTYNITLP